MSAMEVPCNSMGSRISSRAHSPPSPRNTPAGFPGTANPVCCGLDRQRVDLGGGGVYGMNAVPGG